MKRSLILMVMALFLPTIVSPVSGGTALVINHAVFDPESETMTLNGSNFDSFGELEVWIGDTCLTCGVMSGCKYTAEVIGCGLAGTPPATTGGTWVVRVSACNAPHCKDEIHLAINTGGMACTSGDFVDCYTGTQGTVDVGECVPGVRTCADGEWGLECVGEIVPADEVCWDSLDNDCDNQVDCDDPDCAESPDCGCDPGWEDCDGDPSNGCEVDLFTDALNCGACGADCSDLDSPAECLAPHLCQGVRTVGLCSSASCLADTIRDDTACDSSILANHCGLFPDVYCTGDGQPPYPCATTCGGEDDSLCDLIAHCDNDTCVLDLNDGANCDENSDCVSNNCLLGICVP